MAHQYSVEIHEFLSSRLQQSQRELEQARAAGDSQRTQFIEGKLSELNFMRNLLTEKFDLQHRKYY